MFGIARGGGGGMIFDARPYKPDKADRAPHPLGQPVSRPPWMPTPPGEVGRDGKVKPLGNSAEMTSTALVPQAGYRQMHKSADDVPRGVKQNQQQHEQRSDPFGDRPPPQRPPPMRPPNSAPQGGRAPAADFAAGPSAAAANVTQQVIADLEPPSVDDLFALYRLCGGDESKVIELLSRMWGTQPEAIAPTVRVWLGGLPAQYKPPSRSRTAPPALPSWFLNVPGLPQLGHANPGLGRSGPIVLPNGVKPPPVSAPAAQGNKGNKEMGRTFDMLMLQKAVENGNARLPNRKDKPQNRLALQPMPEEGPVSFSAPQWMAPVPQKAPSSNASSHNQNQNVNFGFPARPPMGGNNGNGGGGGGGGGGNTFLSQAVNAQNGGGGNGEDALGAFMYAARMGNSIGATSRASRGGRHMR